MGGHAFPGLDVPRLAHEEYESIRDECVDVLQHYYEEVACAPEAPEKEDHGDVDILVCKPKYVFNIDEIAAKLKSTRKTKVGVTTSFAVPHPTKVKSNAQVDVHLCRDGCLKWELWMGGYGDLTQILGTLNRVIGLTMTDKGLFVRVPEIELSNRKASMLFLTNDMDAVMQFLGLNVKEYDEGFANIDQLYAWCASGRFYGHKRLRSNDDDQIPENYRQESKNDRARMRKRQMFADFIVDWAPEHPECFKNEFTVARETVLQDAIDHFHVAESYNIMMHKWNLEQQEIEILEEIRKAIPEEGERLKQTIRGLKRWTTFQSCPSLKDEEAPNDPSSALLWLRELNGDRKKSFLDWVTINHPELRRRERRRASRRGINLGNGTEEYSVGD